MADIATHMIGIKEPTTQTFDFSLSSNDVERINQNALEVERHLKEAAAPPFDQTRKPELWNWINPTIQKKG